MGANAQTAVPVFTAGQVLTAAQVTQINTGIPVFATTVTRDAAFGGTGEKTLAQGQTCYIEATSSYQTYTGSSWISAGGLAVVKSETSFSAASLVTADNVFTSAYTNYRIVLRFTSTTASAILMRMRVGGTEAITNYNYQLLAGFSATTSAARTTSANTAVVSYGSNGSFHSSTDLFISGPAVAEATSYMSNSSTSDGAYTAPYINLWFGNHSTATAYDGISIFPGSGTMTGTYTIYGLAK